MQAAQTQGDRRRLTENSGVGSCSSITWHSQVQGSSQDSFEGRRAPGWGSPGGSGAGPERGGSRNRTEPGGGVKVC